MSDVVAEATLNGKVLKILQDSDPQNPREDDDGMISIMVCKHRKYSLGDKHDYDLDQFDTANDLEKEIIKREKPIVILPVYLYDHSGITISTTPFSCQWDSSMIGFIYTTQKMVEKVGLTLKNDEKWPEYVQRITESILAEMETYDLYLQGEVYGFELTNANGEEDSCWGFYGTDWKNNGIADYVDDNLIALL